MVPKGPDLWSLINPNDILVFDRGYYSDDIRKLLETNGLHYIFRLPCSNNYCKLEGNDTKIKGEKNLRKIEYIINNKEYYLLTNLDVTEFPYEKLRDLYHYRWAVEEYFKQLKTHVSSDFYSLRSENAIKSDEVIPLVVKFTCNNC